MSEDDDRWVGQWSLQLVETLRACQGICRMLANDALIRIESPEEKYGRASAWLTASRAKLEQLIEQLGEPL